MKTKLTNLVIVLMISWTSFALADIIYVDGQAPGPAHNGSSWTETFNHLQDALAVAESSDQIWVAQGIYRPDEDTANPTGTGDRTAAFELINDVEIKGGYAGYSAPDPDARDIGLYETTLSGDIGTLDDNSDNCYHVFYHPEGTGLDATAILDGFTITAGNASIGGWSNLHAYGGGMYNRNSSPTVTNCTFAGNSANGDRASGGGMENEQYSSPTVTNCTFSGNSAYWGGGMCNVSYSSPTVTNCIFWGNMALCGCEITNRSDSVVVISYCDIEGSGGSGPDWNTNLGIDQGGNIDNDPLFVDPNGLDGIIGTQDDNLRLSPESPCIDVGDNSVVDANSTDLDGNERIINGIVDMGAYETLDALGSIEVDVHIVPRVINSNNRLKRVMAFMRLPEGISKGDVVPESFELYARGLDDGEPIVAILERVIGQGNMTKVFVLFDKNEVMNAVEDVVSRVELIVVGRLKSGQYIQGSDTVRIVKPRQPRPNWQAGKHKLWKK